MTLEQINGWITVGSILVGTGQATITQFKAMFLLLRGDVPESELDAILVAVGDDARRRQALARLDRAQAEADAAAGG